MAIKDLYSDTILETIKSLGKNAIVRIGGIDYTFPLMHTQIENGVLKHFVYIDEEEGTIESVRLVDGLGRDLQTKETTVQKGADGLVVVFVVKIKIEEGV